VNEYDQEEACNATIQHATDKRVSMMPSIKRTDLVRTFLKILSMRLLGTPQSSFVAAHILISRTSRLFCLLAFSASFLGGRAFGLGLGALLVPLPLPLDPQRCASH